jgi:flagellar assembly protein FliH
MPSSEAITYAFPQLERLANFPPGGAEDILSAAWAEAEQVREQARREGEAAGRAEGLADARAQTAQAVAALTEAATAIEALRAEVVAALESQSAELALALAEHIIAGAVEIAPERVIDVTRGALRRLTERHRVIVVVNPADLELVSHSASSLQHELGGIDHLDVQADRRIGRGGALVRTEYGELDASIAAQLQTAREIIASGLRGEDLDVSDALDAL